VPSKASAGHCKGESLHSIEKFSVFGNFGLKSWKSRREKFQVFFARRVTQINLAKKIRRENEVSPPSVGPCLDSISCSHSLLENTIFPNRQTQRAN
jgi:hypothetical protein